MQKLKNPSFSNYFEHWITTYKKGTIQRVTYRKYENSLVKLREYEELDDINAYDKISYQQLINRYAQTHSIQTVKDFNIHLRSCVRELIDEGILLRDFTSKVKITGNPPPVRKKFLEEDELKKLVRALNLDRKELNWDHFIYLLLTTGMRFAEGMGLTPEDFDFDNLTVSINKTYDYKASCIKKNADSSNFTRTKTLSSVRVVRLDFRTAYILRDLIENAPQGKSIWADWYYSNSNAKAIYNTTINDQLKRACKRAGIDPISVHSLRHTHASLLIANEVDMQVVSKRLGHSKTSITQDVYTHLMGAAEQKAQSKINAVMAGI